MVSINMIFHAAINMIFHATRKREPFVVSISILAMLVKFFIVSYKLIDARVLFILGPANLDLWISFK